MQFYIPITVRIKYWGSTYPTNLSSLSVLQNKADKAICGGHCRDHLSPFYSELKIL